MKLKIFLIVTALLPLSIYAQHSIQSAFYPDNKFLINPANTGDKESSPFILVGYRNNNTGISGSYRRPLVAFHSPVNNQMGLGLMTSLEQEGVFSYYSLSGSYSYTAKLSKKNFLRFGLLSGLYSRQINKNSIIVDNPEDVVLQSDYYSKIYYFGGVGFEFTYSNVSLSLSVPKLYSAENDWFMQQIIAGLEYKFEFEQSHLVTSTYFNYEMNQPYSIDLNLLYKWPEHFFALLSGRSDISFAMGGGIEIIGYSFCYMYGLNTKQMDAHPSTHEIIITYKLPSLTFKRY
jgi:type IX secretion system PorP/SprF family membrane protein